MMTSTVLSTAEPIAGQFPANLALVVLTPDLRAAGGASELVARLSMIATEVVASAPVLVTPAQVARLYRRNARVPALSAVDGTWLGRSLFALGPSLAIVVRSSVPTDDFTRFVAQWKCNSQQALRSPGDLCSVSSFAVPAMSMVHTPDDREQAYEDAELLFGAGVLDELSDETGPRLSWEDLLLLIEPVQPSSCLDLAAHRRRIVAKALLTLAADVRLAPLDIRTGPLRAVWAGEAEATIDLVPARDAVRARSSPSSSVEQARIARLVHHRTELVDVVWLLVSSQERGGLVAEHVVAVLRDNGVIFDDWEIHSTLASLAYG